MQEFVVLVDKNDRKKGLMEKMEAHEKGLLHRAISVFVFNSKKELCIQQRALSKYHSAGLWTNTCCSHPRDGEDVLEAAHRRLMEEMGMKCDLKKSFDFIYKAQFDNGLTEHELDHVFIGYSDSEPIINLEEVESYKWISLEDLKNDMAENPESYTAWFKIIFKRFSSTITVV